MKIYFAHSTNFDYKNEYYRPIKESSLNDGNELIFPHDSDDFINTKEIIATSDLVVAEASYISTGMGVELGWANAANKPIIVVYKSGTKPSKSLEVLTHNFIEYSTENLAEKLEKFAATLH